jgi:flagellar basal body L-ring protein FlgH
MSKEATVVKFLSKATPEDVGGEAGAVIFKLGNGSIIKAALDKVPAEMKDRLALHGLSQKIGDACASFAKERDFSSALASMDSVWSNLQQGLWTSRAGSSITDLVTILAKLQKKDAEEVQSALEKATDEQMAAIKKHPAVKKALADLQAERAKEQVKAAAPVGDLLKDIGL